MSEIPQRITHVLHLLNAVTAGSMKMTMKMAIVCLGLLALVSTSTASRGALLGMKEESQELDHTGAPDPFLSQPVKT